MDPRSASPPKYNDGDITYFSTWRPKGMTIHTLVAVEGRRWAIEDSFETGNNELGRDHNETRSWHGWYGHVSLVMLAFAMVTTIRQRPITSPKKNFPNCPGLSRKAANPLVGTRDQAHCQSAWPARYQASALHRMVAMATRASGGGATCSL